jgi:branched-chain amino acid transport system ATP-binding protein
MMQMLEISDLEVSYGLIKAVKGVSFSIGEGEIVSLLGTNGAGKTSAMFGIAGIVKRKGHVKFDNTVIRSGNSVVGARMGLVLCPENRRIFGLLTVEENLKMGTFVLGNYKENLDYVYGLFPMLKERRSQLSGSLSGGEQQMLAVGRALMSMPRLLMLDEPSLGLAPVIVNELFSVLHALKERMSILLVEQNAVKALRISDRAYVMQTGKIVYAGNAAEMLHDERLKRAYLGI